MRLFTLQPLLVYEQLAQGREFQSEPLLDPASWLHDTQAGWGFAQAYDWMCQQMAARGLARPRPQVYPVWAWRQWGGPERPRPDLRQPGVRGSASRTGRHVRLCLEVPDREVLLSDFDGWHFCLNHWYLGTEAEDARFEADCARLGQHAFGGGPLQDPGLHAQMRKSWERMFDLPLAAQVLQVPPHLQQVQATFWTLKPGYVREAEAYGAGLRKARLPVPAALGGTPPRAASKPGSPG